MYIPEECVLTVRVKRDTSWNSNDTDAVYAQVASLKHLLEKLYSDKFDVSIEYN